MQQKGQGSLEYLLIIGGGILVAVVIIGAIVSLAGTGTGGTKANVANQVCHTYLSGFDCSNVKRPTIGADLGTLKDCLNGSPGTDQNACCFTASAPIGTQCSANPYNAYK